jgi:hypothetical protein
VVRFRPWAPDSHEFSNRCSAGRRRVEPIRLSGDTPGTQFPILPTYRGFVLRLARSRRLTALAPSAHAITTARSGRNSMGSSGVCGASRRHHRIPASAPSRRGRIPREAFTQDDNITARFAAEYVHNGLVGGSSPPGPTTQSNTNRDFPWFDEYPRFCGAQGRLAVSAREEGPLQRQVRGLLSPTAKNRFPGAWEAATRDSVRMRQRLICGQVRRAETQFAFESGEAEKYPILCELLH